ncbi:MAG: Maf family protein [Parcubacteria group bacterium]|nr:Maf family protein [Parcubacteria group bacterium]
MKLILGSASKSRQKILKAMGYEFDVLAAGIDEKAIRDRDPQKLTLLLGRAKADAILPQLHEPAILITSDQVVAFRGEIREKPIDEAEARLFLTLTPDEPVQTVTSVVVTNTATGKRVEGLDVVSIYFSPIPKDVIDAYMKRGDCFTHAGGFDVSDPMFKPYVVSMDGEESSVCGLPETLTRKLIEGAS